MTRKENKKDEVYKQVRREKQLHILKKLFVNLGDLPLFLYITISSVWITISTILYVYQTNASLFNEATEIGLGTSVVLGFTFLGIMMLFAWIGFGWMSVEVYKTQLRLFNKGEKKMRGYLVKLVDEITKEEK